MLAPADLSLIRSRGSHVASVHSMLELCHYRFFLSTGCHHDIVTKLNPSCVLDLGGLHVNRFLLLQVLQSILVFFRDENRRPHVVASRRCSSSKGDRPANCASSIPQVRPRDGSSSNRSGNRLVSGTVLEGRNTLFVQGTLLGH